MTSAETLRRRGSERAGFAEAEVASVADDQVIEQRDVEHVGGEAARAPVTVVRRDARLKLQRDGADGASMLEALAAEAGPKRMLPFVVTPPREFSNGHHLSGHAGEEFLFVLKGRVEIAFPGRTESLRAGDAIYFDALVPHRLRSVGSVQASALVVISGGEGAA